MRLFFKRHFHYFQFIIINYFDFVYGSPMLNYGRRKTNRESYNLVPCTNFLVPSIGLLFFFDDLIPGTTNNNNANKLRILEKKNVLKPLLVNLFVVFFEFLLKNIHWQTNFEGVPENSFFSARCNLCFVFLFSMVALGTKYNRNFFNFFLCLEKGI